MKRVAGFACLAVALVTLAGFDYDLYLIFQGGTCASGGPYVSAHPCPPNEGTLSMLLTLSFFVTLVSAMGCANLLGTRWALIWWAALFVPLGVGFAVMGHAVPDIRVVFYGLAVMFVVMGLAPLFMPAKALDGT
jgi:hypothetical protein